VICLIVEVILVFSKYHFLPTIVVGFDESLPLCQNGGLRFDESQQLYEKGGVGLAQAAPLDENGVVGLCDAGLWIGL